MQKKFGIDFEPSQWTSDNSGAIENGIIRVKGPLVKARLGSDKLHDENNLKRVLRTLPTTMQDSVEREIRLMVNGISPEVSENIFQGLLSKAQTQGYQKLYRSLLFHHRKRHKYWNSYREVLDNNCTTEQVNRMQTRNCKSVSLIEGVRKLISSTIVDKAKFKLVVAGKQVNKGPTVQDRQTRVEKAQNKVLVNVVESLEEMISLNDSQEESTNSSGDVLKKKALDDFKSKKSETHRSDKVRRLPVLSKKLAENNQEIIASRKKIKKEALKLINKVDNDSDFIVEITNNLGQNYFVSFSKSVMTCSCGENVSTGLCFHSVFLLDIMQIKDLSAFKNYTEKSFEQVTKASRKIGEVLEPNKQSAGKSKDWDICRSKRSLRCSACKKVIKGNSLFCNIEGVKYCVDRFCVPRTAKKYPAKVNAMLSEDEKSLLVKNGIKQI